MSTGSEGDTNTVLDERAARRAQYMRIQQALADAGFPPGLIDGVFGDGTRAAIRAFQRSRGLLPDGIPGPLTQHALGLAEFATRPSALDLFTAQNVSAMCPGAPLYNIHRHLPTVLQAMQEQGIHDRIMLLMAIATIRAESASFAPVDEGISRWNTSPRGRPFDLYDCRADLGNRGHPDGATFRGRGFVQLTGRANYETYGRRLGISLVDDPAQANHPMIAARLLALFLADREWAIRNAALDDLPAARRLVNGGSHGLAMFVDAWKIGEQFTGLTPARAVLARRDP